MREGKRPKNPDRDGERLFGTDGIRGRWGCFPLDNSSLIRLGVVLQEVLGKKTGSRILMGADPRESSPEIRDILSRAEGYSDCGVISTPGLSFLTRQQAFDYGLMITASHNPYGDNGIKVFNYRGEKASSQLEEEIQEQFDRQPDIPTPAPPPRLPEVSPEPYIRFLTEAGQDIAHAPLKVVIDCANGAVSRIAPRVFRRLGIRNIPIFHHPDGRNINRGCGSEHPAALAARTCRERADLGIAFDGDGDRLLLVDPRGRRIDGDRILYILTRYLAVSSEPVCGVVGTVMSNFGLEKALRRLKIKLYRAPVGDKNVYALLREKGLVLGGEPSGHIIDTRFQPTGDGVLSALLFIKALIKLGIDPEAAVAEFAQTPQKSVSIRVKKRIPLQDWPELQGILQDFQYHHGTDSRALVRYSGTEPKIRIMLESDRPEVIDRYLPRLVKVVEKQIGE